MSVYIENGYVEEGYIEGSIPSSQPSSYLYRIELDNLSGNFIVYVDGSEIPLTSIPYLAYGQPFVAIDDNFSVAYCAENGIDIIYNISDYTTIQNYRFELIGIFDNVASGSYFDFSIWDSSYNTDLFWVTKNIYQTYQGLNDTYFTFDINSSIATGLNYDDGSISSETANCDLSLITPEFDEIDLSIASLDNKVDNLHQKVDFLVTAIQTLATKTDLSSITIDTSNLATKTDLSSITIDTSNLATKTDIEGLVHYDVTNINLPSLNGNGAEFIDGTLVTVLGRDTVYVVNRSFMSLYADNGYTVHYDLVTDTGYKCTVPEALLTKHNEAG